MLGSDRKVLSRSPKRQILIALVSKTTFNTFHRKAFVTLCRLRLRGLRLRGLRLRGFV